MLLRHNSNEHFGDCTFLTKTVNRHACGMIMVMAIPKKGDFGLVTGTAVYVLLPLHSYHYAGLLLLLLLFLV